MIRKIGEKTFVEKRPELEYCPVMWNPYVEEYCRIEYNPNGSWSFVRPLQIVNMQGNDEY